MGAHASIIALFEQVTKDLNDSVSFGYGTADDFDSKRDQKFPYVWTDPITGSFPNDDQRVGDLISWEITVRFLALDNRTGNEKETARVWDAMFDLMEKWIHKLDREFLNDETEDRIQSANVQISSPAFRQIRKVTKDVVSGWAATFTLTSLSTFDYCEIYE